MSSITSLIAHLSYRSLTRQRLHSPHYHWRELPENIYVVTKPVFCHDKSMLVVTKYFCRDKRVFVSTSILLSRQQTCYVCRDKNMFGLTNFLSRQAYFCRDKRSVFSCLLLQRFTFVATKNYTCGSSHNAASKSPSLYRPTT